MCFCGRDCSHIQSKTWDKSTNHRTLAQKQNKQSRTKAGVKAHTVKLCAFVLERVRAWWKGSRSTVDGQRLSNRKDVFLNSEFFFFFTKILVLKVLLANFIFFRIQKYIFYFVNVDCRRSTSMTLHFSWSMSTRLHFSNLLTVDNVDACQHVDVCQRPFYRPFHHARVLHVLWYNFKRHVLGYILKPQTKDKDDQFKIITQI